MLETHSADDGAYGKDTVDAGSIHITRRITEREEEAYTDGRYRAQIKPGAIVDIVLKKDQPTGRLTRGEVKRILTNSVFHPHGIKVMLTDDRVGRVQNIVTEAVQ